MALHAWCVRIATCCGTIADPAQSNCTNDLGGVNWAQGGLTSLCGNGTAVDTVNSCVADSDCSDSDKQSLSRQHSINIISNNG